MSAGDPERSRPAETGSPAVETEASARGGEGVPAAPRASGWLGRVAVADALLSLGVIGYGAYLLVGAGAIRVLPVYSRIGPRFFPYLVALATLACGALLLVDALRGHRAPPEAGEDVDLSARDNLRPVLVIATGLGLGAALMQGAGFVLSATLIFTTVALAFGSRSLLRDAGIGLALALVAYLSFTRLLGLTLPAGVLPL